MEVDSVHEAVKAMVMDHEIEPGAPVASEPLSRTFDVSPTPVREAPARLGPRATSLARSRRRTR